MSWITEQESTSTDLVKHARDLSTGFFDLVHMADLLQQIVQALFESHVEPLLAGKDQKSVASKKRFERVLDELVAGGIDESINCALFLLSPRANANSSISVLLWRAKRVLDSEQHKDDFIREPPPADQIQPTKACTFACDIVNIHANEVVSVVDDSIREALLNEIGQRFFLCAPTKHSFESFS